MPLLSLNDNPLYQMLVNRRTSNSIQYAGLLQPIAEDINYLLEYVKTTFPEYPSHNFQHSIRILNYIDSLLSDDNKNELSDTELFCLIMAALFHDTSMAMYNKTIAKDELRDKHHELSAEVLDQYFTDKLSVLPSRERIKSAIEFACTSHNLDIKELYESNLYIRKDKVNGDTTRYSILASFIRIGDLLDLDCDRVNEYVMSSFSKTYSKISFAHNMRHLKVQQYYYNQSEINVEVFAEDVEQFKIWTTWFEYIKSEILYINTYLQNYGFHLPKPNTKIAKSPNARFEVEELRFEIDDSGGIWKILSQSIYTDEFDFVRELLQNAIDATLLPTYLDDAVDVLYPSPRAWNISEKVYIGFSESRQELYVVDSGIGMDSSGLKRFLFKITGTGYSDYSSRPFKFPAIAKFGIGFVSCLINADEIEIFTRKRDSETTYNVSLSSNNNLAIMQKIEADNFYGTVIKLHLKHNYSCERLLNYIIETFVYPSVNICIIDIDELEKTYNPLIRSESFENILSHPYKLINSYNRYLDECNKHLKPLNEQKKLLSNVHQELDKLYMWLDVNRDIDEDFSDKDKVKYFRKKLKLITKDIEQIEILPAFELSYKQINEEQLFNDIQYYLDHLTFYKDKIESLIDTNNKKRNMYRKCSRDISQDEVLFDVPWDYCIIVFDSEFSISDIVFDQQIDLANKMGIVLTHHSVKDFDEGYEYSSINGMLFTNGEICNSISRLSGHYYRQIAHSKHDDYVFIGGMNSDFDFSEIVDECKDQYDGIDEFWIDKVFSLVICESDGFHFYSDVTENELNAKKHQKNDIFIISTLIDNYLISVQDKLSEEDLINVSNLGIILDKDKNLLCQDGIKLQENLFDLFPIGYSKIRCNLTASSKMILNVTRHKISEIHSEINPWIEKTAFCIQKSIFKNVNTILGELSMQCGNCDLNNLDYSNLLSNKIRHQFTTKVLKS